VKNWFIRNSANIAKTAEAVGYIADLGAGIGAVTILANPLAGLIVAGCCLTVSIAAKLTNLLALYCVSFILYDANCDIFNFQN
jgi:hypothetical protein